MTSSGSSPLARARFAYAQSCSDWLICRGPVERNVRPDPRVGKRQRACGQADCQAVHRRKMQAAWRRRNPDYFVARRMQERGTQEQPPEPLRLPSPLSRLPWDVAQSEFGVQGADFLGVMGKVLLRPAQTEFWAYPLDSKQVAGTLPPPLAQSEIPGPAG